MIGSVSSASSAYYGMQRHSPGERSTGVPTAEEEKPELSTSDKAKEKEQEEKFSNPQKLDEDEKEQVEKLKLRDAEVRAHEQAHMAAAGSLAQGGPNYDFQTGPDGKQYAIGGDIKIDTSPGKTPEESSRKAQQIRSAALAAADPSAQDLKVAASAASMEMESASKTADKSEKESSKTGAASDSREQEAKGEISSSRQIFAASPSDSGSENPPDSGPRPNVYMIQAAKLYPSQATAAGA